MKLRTLIVALIAALIGTAGAQTSPDTVSQKISQFGNIQFLPGPSEQVRNVGQTSHLLTYCANGAILQLALEGSFDNTNWQQISNFGTLSSGCETLYASGYYPFVRVNFYTISGGTAPTNVFYSGSKNNVIAGAMSPPLTPTIAADQGLQVNLNVNSTSPWTPFVLASGTFYFFGADVTNLTGATLYVSGGPLASTIAVPAGSTYQYRTPGPYIGSFGTGIKCSTSASSSVDPAASTCQVTVYYRLQKILNTRVNTSGTILSTGKYPTY